MNVIKEQIASYEIFEKATAKRYMWKEEQKTLWWVSQKEGFYHCLFYDTFISNEDINKDKTLFIENKKVYYKPHVTMIMSNGKAYDKFFETVVELKSFVAENLHGIEV